MRLWVLGATLAAAFLPTLVAAQGACDHRRLKSAEISCAEGHAWDAEAGRCVPVNS